MITTESFRLLNLPLKMTFILTLEMTFILTLKMIIILTLKMILILTEYLEVMAAGEAATWPFISRIKAHCYVEMTLDK